MVFIKLGLLFVCWWVWFRRLGLVDNVDRKCWSDVLE